MLVKYMIKRKTKPAFNVLNAGFKKRIKHRWRKPRGTDNKKRAKFSYAGASPCIGYKNASKVRGLHPCGLHEVIVHNVAELKTAIGKAVRIAGSIGKRNKDKIKKAAEEMKIKLLN